MVSISSQPRGSAGVAIHLENRRELDGHVERQGAWPHGEPGVFADGLAEDLDEEIRGPVPWSWQTRRT